MTKGNIVLLDLQGRKVRELRFNGDSHIIPINDLQSGIYFIQIKAGGEIVNKKIVIE